MTAGPLPRPICYRVGRLALRQMPKDPLIRDKFAQERSAKRFINYVLGIVEQ